eukprot:5964606-Amphidinium_carterae.1
MKITIIVPKRYLTRRYSIILVCVVQRQQPSPSSSSWTKFRGTSPCSFTHRARSKQSTASLRLIDSFPGGTNGISDVLSKSWGHLHHLLAQAKKGQRKKICNNPLSYCCDRLLLDALHCL